MQSADDNVIYSALSSVTERLVSKDPPKDRSHKKLEPSPSSPSFTSQVVDMLTSECDKHSDETKQLLSEDRNEKLQQLDHSIMIHPGDVVHIRSATPEKSYEDSVYSLHRLNSQQFSEKGIYLSQAMMSDHALRHYVTA